jgi:hypothetical protein
VREWQKSFDSAGSVVPDVEMRLEDAPPSRQQYPPPSPLAPYHAGWYVAAWALYHCFAAAENTDLDRTKDWKVISMAMFKDRVLQWFTQNSPSYFQSFAVRLHATYDELRPVVSCTSLIYGLHSAHSLTAECLLVIHNAITVEDQQVILTPRLLESFWERGTPKLDDVASELVCFVF